MRSQATCTVRTYHRLPLQAEVDVVSAPVTAQCCAGGHAAGLAVAIASGQRIAPRSIAGEERRALLAADGLRRDA